MKSPRLAAISSWRRRSPISRRWPLSSDRSWKTTISASWVVKRRFARKKTCLRTSFPFPTKAWLPCEADLLRARRAIFISATSGRPSWPGSKCARPEAPWSFGLKISMNSVRRPFTPRPYGRPFLAGPYLGRRSRCGRPLRAYIQQERYDRYDEALAVLREKGLLYPCYCSRTRLQAIGAPHAGEHTVYDGHCYGSVKMSAAV